CCRDTCGSSVSPKLGPGRQGCGLPGSGRGDRTRPAFVVIVDPGTVLCCVASPVRSGGVCGCSSSVESPCCGGGGCGRGGSGLARPFGARHRPGPGVGLLRHRCAAVGIRPGWTPGPGDRPGGVAGTVAC